jgi:hypothetical protein
MSSLQINPYDINSFKRDPYTKEVAKHIYKAFGPVNLDFLPWFSEDFAERPNHRPYSYIPDYRTELDIRENYLVSPTNRLFNISIFYYIKFLLQLNPDKIMDIGCSTNIFKKVYPKIYGISDNSKHLIADDVHPGADEIIAFDHEFSKKYENQFQCAMAINSVHFVPITYFEQQVINFLNTIKPGGRGFLTFNIIKSIEKTSDIKLIELFQTTFPSQKQIAFYIDQKIRNMPFNFLVIENLIEQVKNDPINGTVRLVIEK